MPHYQSEDPISFLIAPRTGIDKMTSLKTARQIKTAAQVEIDIEALEHLAYVAASV